MEKENRSAKRSPTSQLLVIVPILNGMRYPKVQAQLQDISLKGVCIACSMPMVRNDQFLVPLLGKKKGQLLYTVAHSHHEADGVYVIGAEFTCVVGSEPQTNPNSIADLRAAILS